MADDDARGDQAGADALQQLAHREPLHVLADETLGFILFHLLSPFL